MDPFYETVKELSEVIGKSSGSGTGDVVKLLRFSTGKYGDISFPLIRYAKKGDIPLSNLYDKIISEINRNSLLKRTIGKVSLDKGYLNISLDTVEMSKMYYSILRNNRLEVPKTPEGKTIVVEHTSANPVHPLHMGHARNSSIGDTLSRLLKARGHRVNTRFYIDDVGRQVAVAALGVKLLGKSVREIAGEYGLKPDWAIGYIYSLTHLLLDIYELTKKIEEARDEDERKLLVNKRDDLLIDLSRIIETAPKGLGERLLKAFEKLREEGDPLEELRKIMYSYEHRKDDNVVRLIRESVEASLEGFRETLGLMGVEFDEWDWESDVVWSGLVDEIIEKARKSPYITIHKGALALDLTYAASQEEVRKAIELPRSLEIPPLILVRSDGTTLYTTRDIAYTLLKFRKTGASKVINVIGADQRLPQIQIRLALYTLGYKKEALNTIHYAYEIVRLPGERMSGRRGRLLGLDDVLKRTHSVALEEVLKRNPGLGEEEADRIAWKIAVGAVRFSMVSFNAMRPITYSVERATSFEGNSGAYIQYTYARANGILRKHGEIDWESIKYETVNDPSIRTLFLEAIKTPFTAAKAADDMKPELLANYLVELADVFNSWYQKDSVIQEKDSGKRMFKAALVLLVKEALGLGMDLLGIPLTPRM